MLHSRHSSRTLALFGGIGLLAAAMLGPLPGHQETRSVIVQGSDLASVRSAVLAAGGEITHELGIIGAVTAALTETELHALKSSPGVGRIYENASLTSAARRPKKNKRVASDSFTATSDSSVGVVDSAEASHSTLVGADRLHGEGITGDGVTLAVLDTGLSYYDQIKRGADDDMRTLAQYDAIQDQELSIWAEPNDGSGHATHVASVSLNSEILSASGKYRGIAPDAGFVSVKAFDADGHGSYADVIRGIDWIVANRDLYGIRVLNLSFSAPPRSHYWDDPLNQAVMAAWQAGILVVASAGNAGPDPMTVGVPGNVPYVVTVGAMTDGYTPEDPSDDELASFSSAGPTHEGFVKPEVVAPGGHIVALMNDDGQIALEHPEFRDEDGMYFTMSGTSQSAAVVSGIVALMLQADPGLSPDEVKCRLMASARSANTAGGEHAYGILQQGAGLVSAYEAVYSTATGCANRGLDIAADLAGQQHFAGPVRRDESGDFYIEGPDGTLYNGSFLWSASFLWSDSFLWADSFLWSDSFLWADSFLWSDALTETVGINVWVPQE